MAKEFARTDRVGDFLKKELSLLIQREMRDPRVGMVSITDVEVTRDLSYAKVFVTFMGVEGEEAIAEGVKVLNGAAGYLRSLLSKTHRMRTTPKIKFLYDKSVSQGSYLSGLIDRAVSDDRRDDEE
ncbi:30S ribosome-binding factor RbfA [Umboniibacter marinipuniceus]|uniref:Ribosome-binding factor A n=1 Tax=Umboniibacter marinipuniceus TaxID=569599 RepID=A0A3M0A4Y2_9GAMM|nr:30S ribosome-binding factor RbfA [Umboniibacter marinipuniceus]RMA80093.1 ribosome-binding factor A [Umboniibacter marinipuniceus]